MKPFDVTAKARVEIKKLEEFKGILPWAVPEFNPNALAVIFVNEATGAVHQLAAPEPNGYASLEQRLADVWEADAIIRDDRRVGAVILSQQH